VIDDTGRLATPDEMAAIDAFNDRLVAGPVTRDDFLRAWLLEYLPLIRVVPIGGRAPGLARPGRDGAAPPSRPARPDPD
jgi:hypothetical protein